MEKDMGNEKETGVPLISIIVFWGLYIYVYIHIYIYTHPPHFWRLPLTSKEKP